MKLPFSEATSEEGKGQTEKSRETQKIESIWISNLDIFDILKILFYYLIKFCFINWIFCRELWKKHSNAFYLSE